MYHAPHGPRLFAAPNVVDDPSVFSSTPALLHRPRWKCSACSFADFSRPVIATKLQLVVDGPTLIDLISHFTSAGFSRTCSRINCVAQSWFS